MAVQEYQDSEGSTFSQSSFFSFWKGNHKVIKIPKNLKMGQCDTCLELKRLKVSSISKTELATKVSEHNILQSKAQRYCDEMHILARQQPFAHLYIQFDGKQASRLPHINPLPKETQILPHIRTFVYGASNFSDNTSHFYLGFPHWSAGPNLSITILYDRILCFFQTIDHKRPFQFVLQVDNCAKDGKNKFIFAFAAHLVHWNWFKEVLIVSLIQGHTHDLIDQEFAVWTAGEHRYELHSFHKLANFITQIFYKKKTSFTVLKRMYDWVSYFDSTLTEFSHYSTARLFKFFKESDNVVMKFKTNPLEADWHGFHTEDNVEHGIQVCSSFQQHAPHAIIPDPLHKDQVSVVANHAAYVCCYDSIDCAFWSGMDCDSVAYLQTNEPFHKESKYFQLSLGLRSNLIDISSAVALPFLSNDHIWNVAGSSFPPMYFIGEDFQFERPAAIQVNIEQQTQLSDIVFSLRPGFYTVNIFSHF